MQLDRFEGKTTARLKRGGEAKKVQEESNKTYLWTKKCRRGYRCITNADIDRILQKKHILRSHYNEEGDLDSCIGER